MAAIRINAFTGPYPMDLAGKQFGHAKAADFNFIRTDGKTIWLCRCVCGKEWFTDLLDVRKKQSCGCISVYATYKLSIFFGHPDFLRIMAIFNGMQTRCYNADSDGYKYYGARGINICDEWREDRDKFMLWALTHGYESHLTIDRRDNYKGYVETNCRFITNSEQQKNKRCHQDARGGTPA